MQASDEILSGVITGELMKSGALRILASDLYLWRQAEESASMTIVGRAERARRPRDYSSEIAGGRSSLDGTYDFEHELMA